MGMSKTAIIAALEREVSGLIRRSRRVEHDHSGRTFTFYELGDSILVAGGIGLDAARRCAEAAVALYHPDLLLSVGFAGALQPDMRVGDMFIPSLVIDCRDGSRTSMAGGSGTLLTCAQVAGTQQKAKLAQAYAAQAVDMEAAAVATAARAHGIAFRATKVISDGFEFNMPDVSRFIDAQGRFCNASFALYAALRPWLWPRVAELARNSGKAAKTLGEYLSDPRHLPNNPIEAKTI
jgi:adenosylhomocysteine nucleosidase